MGDYNQSMDELYQSFRDLCSKRYSMGEIERGIHINEARMMLGKINEGLNSRMVNPVVSYWLDSAKENLELRMQNQGFNQKAGL